MTTNTTSLLGSIRLVELITRVAIGGGIALALVLLFLSGVHYTDPSWSPFWILRPLLIVPFAGATGGLCSYFIMEYVGQKSTGAKLAGGFFCVLVYMFGLWMGTVLGFEGTLWN